MEKVKFAVVGCGSFSRNHIRGVKEHKKAQLVALCDLNTENMQKKIDEFELDVETYTDYDEMLRKADIDAVIVSTGDQMHCELSVKAMRAGKHVLCEKPMALTIEDCEEMIKAEDETGMKLMIGQICRMTPGFIEAKRLLDEGVIGELFYAESTYAHDYTYKFAQKNAWREDPLRHIVIGGACHAIDLLRWIVGNPTETTAYSNHKVHTDIPSDDCTVAIFRFPDNVIGKVFTSSGCKRPYTMRTQLYGTKGTILVDNTDGFITVYRERIAGDKILDGAFGKEQENEVTLSYPITLNNHNIEGEHTAFIEAILNDTPVPTDGREGLATVRVCRAVIDSADEGRTVKIEY